MPRETTPIKVIVINFLGQKALIGFDSNPIEFVKKWISNRPQYTDFQAINERHFTVICEGPEDLTHFYATSLRDGETCWVSLNDNCMGFNDNH